MIFKNMPLKFLPPVQSSWFQKGNSLLKNVIQCVYCQNQSTCFLLLPNPQNPMFYNTFQWVRHPKLPPLMEASTSPCYTCFLDPVNSAFQTASWSVQPFSRSPRQSPC